MPGIRIIHSLIAITASLCIPASMSRLAGKNLSAEASQRQQINDLVRRHESDTARILALQSSQTALEAQFQTDMAQHRKGVEAAAAKMAMMYGTVIRRLKHELSVERTGAVKAQEAVRRERLECLRRDFKIYKFSVGEAEWQAALDAEIDARERMGKEKDAAAADAHALALTQINKLQGRVRGKEEEVERLIGEVAAARIAATQETGATERLATMAVELEDLRATKGRMEEQLDRWRQFETKNQGALEEERKRRVTAEAEIQALQGQVEKARKKVGTYRESLVQWQEHAAAQQEEMDAAQEEHEKLVEENQTLKDKVERLQEQLAQANATVANSSPRKVRCIH